MNFITIFDIAYLLALMAILLIQLVLSAKRAKRDQKILNTLVDVSSSNAQSVKDAVKAVQDVIELMKEALNAQHP